MSLEELRYSLTNHRKRILFEYENQRLLIHPEVYTINDNCNNVINRIKDDFELIPDIKETKDKSIIKFYNYDYKEYIFKKSELLVFIFASLNSDWDIVEGIDSLSLIPHYWLKSNNCVYDPSLSIITPTYIYNEKSNFKEIILFKIKMFLIIYIVIII